MDMIIRPGEGRINGKQDILVVQKTLCNGPKPDRPVQGYAIVLSFNLLNVSGLCLDPDQQVRR